MILQRAYSNKEQMFGVGTQDAKNTKNTSNLNK